MNNMKALIRTDSYQQFKLAVVGLGGCQEKDVFFFFSITLCSLWMSRNQMNLVETRIFLVSFSLVFLSWLLLVEKSTI